jgi:holo-[acyl-carrier protein] synthase
MSDLMILGHGIDIIEIATIRRLLEMPDSQWTLASFTLAERDIADAPPHDLQFYAGRFAAKEAIAKALGTGISGDIAWTDIEILRHPTGFPLVSLFNEAQSIADRLRVTRWFVSISHSDSFAIASAIAVSE